MTYAVLETRYRVNRWYLWQFIHRDDYQPPPKVAAALGIQIYQPAPVCPRCGIVHVAKRCTRRAVAWSQTPIAVLPVDVLRWKLDNREPA